MVVTACGASAVQVVLGYKDRWPVVDHHGSAHAADELVVLQVRARRVIAGGQSQLDLGIDAVADLATGSENDLVAITGEHAGLLLDAIAGGFQHLGFEHF